MSYYYERPAEEKGYFHFQRREVSDTSAHFHSAPEFLFAEKGDQLVTIGGEKRILHEGEACFSEGFCIHSYSRVEGSIGHVLLGEKGYFDKIFAAFSGKLPPRFFRFDDYGLLNSLRELCNKDYAKEEHRRVAFEGAMGVLLAAVAETIPFEERKEDKHSSLVCEVLGYASEHLESDLSLAALSKRFGYTREHLCRILRKYLSENWNVYVGRLRARRANELLAERPDSSVLKIAFDCGFDSPNTFYRAYKKEFGDNPPRRAKRKNINF